MKRASNSDYQNVWDYDGLGEKECMQNIGDKISWQAIILKTVKKLQWYY